MKSCYRAAAAARACSAPTAPSGWAAPRVRVRAIPRRGSCPARADSAPSRP